MPVLIVDAVAVSGSLGLLQEASGEDTPVVDVQRVDGHPPRMTC